MFGNYVNDELQFLPQEEGRIRYNADSATWNYDYFLKDHLGNVRMVLTDEQKTDQYIPASLEDGPQAAEEALYGNLSVGKTETYSVSGYPSDDYTDPNTYIQMLRAEEHKIGTNITLKVMAGDKVNIRVSSWYRKNYLPGNNDYILSDLLLNLTTGVAGQSSGKILQTQLSGSGSPVSSGLSSFLSNQSSSDYDDRKPMAFLNWILFDEQFNYVASSSGSDQVGDDDEFKVHPIDGLEMTKNGYLFVYTSNASTSQPVYFDNLQVTHIRGPILEETHYYPYGSMQQGISSIAVAFGTPSNKMKFNEKEEQRQEFSDGNGLEVLDFGHRFYDMQIGRFFTQDRIADSFPSFSPYHYSRNNPILYIDLMGDSAWKITNTWNDETIGKYREFANNRIQEAYKKGEKFTCEDLALTTLVDFASQNGLPVVIENGKYTISAASDEFNNVSDFKCKVLATTAASDLPENGNTVPVDKGSVQTGDLLLHNNSESDPDRTTHTQVVSGNTKNCIYVYQGNQSGGSADPCGFWSYCGVKTQAGYYVKRSGNFVRTDTDKVVPGLLNRSTVHGAAWNFKSWNGR